MNIILVDDKPENLFALQSTLEEEFDLNYQVIWTLEIVRSKVCS